MRASNHRIVVKMLKLAASIYQYVVLLDVNLARKKALLLTRSIQSMREMDESKENGNDLRTHTNSSNNAHLTRFMSILFRPYGWHFPYGERVPDIIGYWTDAFDASRHARIKSGPWETFMQGVHRAEKISFWRRHTVVCGCDGR